MTIKTFCDGCDNEITDDRWVTLAVHFSVPPRAVHIPAPKVMDLCEYCLAEFRHRHLPTKWARTSAKAAS